MVSGLSELIGRHVLFTMVRCDDCGLPGLHRQGLAELIPCPPLYDQFGKVDREQVFELESTGEEVIDIDYTLLCIKWPH